MSNKKKSKKWYNYISPGKAGDEETEVFKALARHPKFDWRSVASIAKEGKLKESRVEEILLRFLSIGVVLQKADNEELWAYWERVPSMIAGDPGSITDADQDERIDKSIGKTTPSIAKSPSTGSGSTGSGSTGSGSTGTGKSPGTGKSQHRKRPEALVLPRIWWISALILWTTNL
jgi:hypothetical protein